MNRVKTAVRETEGYNNLDIWKGKDKLIENVRGILNDSEGALKSYVNFIDRTYSQRGLTAKEFENQKLELYAMKEFKGLTKEERNAAAIYAYLLGEHRISNFLQGQEHIEYFMKADKNLQERGDKIGVKIELPETIDFKSFSDEQIAGAIETLQKDLLEETDQANIDVKSYELEKLEEIQRIKAFDDVAVADEKKALVEEAVRESTPIPEEIHYDFPEISYDSIDRSPQAINEILSIHKDYRSVAEEGLKVTMQSLFNKYAPAFLAVYDTVRGFMNWDNTIQLANEYHILEMGDRWLGDKDSIFHQIKKSGMNTAQSEELVKKVERALLGGSGNKFMVEDIDSSLQSLKDLFKGTPALALLDQEQFIKRMKMYQEKVITPVAKRLNDLQDYYKIDILKKYGDVNFSIVTDTLEAHKGNAQLALKIHGIKDKAAFMAMLENNSNML